VRCSKSSNVPENSGMNANLIRASTIACTQSSCSDRNRFPGKAAEIIHCVHDGDADAANIESGFQIRYAGSADRHFNAVRILLKLR
jgi:hypothetical protein